MEGAALRRRDWRQEGRAARAGRRAGSALLLSVRRGWHGDELDCDRIEGAPMVWHPGQLQGARAAGPRAVGSAHHVPAGQQGHPVPSRATAQRTQGAAGHAAVQADHGQRRHLEPQHVRRRLRRPAAVGPGRQLAHSRGAAARARDQPQRARAAPGAHRGGRDAARAGRWQAADRHGAGGGRRQRLQHRLKRRTVCGERQRGPRDGAAQGYDPD
mmetsp:Transcript_35274/g.92684  ORF Transcript_35274/g.92684 Transcript_35274/m.92684 type:complete len:214 (-) Transcript_35274:346-987(-)